MTQSRLEALADILAEAEKLKMYREDGATYREKCDNLVVRINTVLSDAKIEDLDSFEIKEITLIRNLVNIEEVYARSSSDLRDASKWFSDQNE